MGITPHSTVKNFRPWSGNRTLRAYFDILLPGFDFIIQDWMLHETANGSRWVSPQALPQIDANGTIRKINGKKAYKQHILWESPGARERFTADILAQIDALTDGMR
jgi:hypothetical protein